jgi:hypothetical protein
MTDVNFDAFLISKSYIVADIDELIQSMMNLPNLSVNNLQGLMADYRLHHQIEDAEERKNNPYIMDAIHMAMSSGQIDEETARIVHEGESNPQYQEAFQRTLAVGSQLMNAAAARQNQLNQASGFEPAPLPFTASGELHPDYRKEVRSTISRQTGGGTRNAVAFNPYNNNGELVTHIVSDKHTVSKDDPLHDKPGEGYARWYEAAAKEMGLLPGDYSKKTGKRSDRFRYLIPAHFIHDNVIQINDIDQMKEIAQIMQNAQMQNIQDPATIREMVMDLPKSFHHTNFRNHNFESYYNRANRKEQDALEIQEGISDLPIETIGQPQSVLPDKSILHPELLGDGSWGSRTYQDKVSVQSNLATASGQKKITKDLIEHHGFSETEASEVIAGLLQGRKGPYEGRNPLQRLQHALWQHHTKDGSIPEWYQHPEGQPMPPMGGTPITAGPIQPQPQPSVVSTPPAGPQNPPAMPPPTGNPMTPPPQTNPTATPPPSTELNTNVPNINPINGGRGLADMISRFRQRNVERQREARRALGLDPEGFVIKSEVESYLEQVQYELAKATLEDMRSVTKMSITDPVHIALASSQIQRSTTDVVAIYHTKGDWRNIAKSFGIEHQDVQFVKVAFNE